MKRNLLFNSCAILTVTLIVFGLQKGSAHGNEEGPVALEPDHITAKAGSVNYTFQLVDTASNKLIADGDLNVVHEKKVHVFVYDPSLTAFKHVHPNFIGGKWQVSFDLSVNGNYWVWAQGETSAGKEFTASNRLEILGGTSAHPAPPILADVRQGSDGTSKVTFEAKKIYANKLTMLKFEFSRTDRTRPAVTDYLGARAHFVIVPDDGDSLIHVHPMAGSNANNGMIHVKFPAAGNYRVWMQFLDAGVLRTVSMSIQVLK